MKSTRDGCFSCFVPCASCCINKWVITQTNNIYEQLNNGIRALDLRFSFIDNTFYVSHTFGLIPLDTAFDQVKKFLQENPIEIIVILIKPDFDNKDVMVSHEKELFSEIKKHISSYMIPNGADLTVSEIIKSSKNILVSYTNSLIFTDPEFYPFQNRIWLDAKSRNEFLDKYNLINKGSNRLIKINGFQLKKRLLKK